MPKSQAKRGKTLRKILFKKQQNDDQDVSMTDNLQTKGSGIVKDSGQSNNNATRATRSTARSSPKDDETMYDRLLRKVKESKKQLQTEGLNPEREQAHCSAKVDSSNEQSQILQDQAQVHQSKDDGVYVDVGAEEELDYEDDVVYSDTEVF